MSYWTASDPVDSKAQVNINSVLGEYFLRLDELKNSNSTIKTFITNEVETQSGTVDQGFRQNDSGAADLNDTVADGSASLNNDDVKKSNKEVSTVKGKNSNAISGNRVNGQNQEEDEILEIDSSFIDRLLDEKENLVLEIATNQNPNLLNFICVGFFVKRQQTKKNSIVYEKKLNLDYLIDRLLAELDELDELDEINENKDSYSKNKPSIERNSPIELADIIGSILSLNCPQLIDALFENNTKYGTLDKLWSIIQHKQIKYEESTCTQIFLKIHNNLLSVQQGEYIDYLKSNPQLVEDILSAIDSSVLMDFLLQCIATDTKENTNGFLFVLNTQKLIPKLLDIIEFPCFEFCCKSSAGDVLRAIITISANSQVHEMTIGPNVLTRELVSPIIAKRILNIIVEKRGYPLNIIIEVIIELIRKNNHDFDPINVTKESLVSAPPDDRDPIFLGYLLEIFSENLHKLYQILLDVENDNTIPLMENQIGLKFKPLGFERLRIVELIAELLHCSNMNILNSRNSMQIVIARDEYRLNKSSKQTVFNENTENEEEVFEEPYISVKTNQKLRTNPTLGDLFKIKLYDLDILSKLMNLFLEYQFNSIWDNAVYDILQQIYNGKMKGSYNSFLIYALFDSKLASVYRNKNGNEINQENHKLENGFEIISTFILKGYKRSYEFYEKMNTNLGYMGHLVLIAEELVAFSNKIDVKTLSLDIYNKLQDYDWLHYSNEVLSETRIMYSKILSVGSFVEDEFGNITPQISDGNDSTESIINPDMTKSDDQVANKNNKRDKPFNGSIANRKVNDRVCNIHDLEDELTYSTESDIHEKLRKILVERSQKEVNERNKANGVIILGPP